MSSAPDGSDGQYEIGVQSFTYREFDVSEICSELSGTGVSAIELCDVHVAPDAAAEVVERVRDRLADSGIEVCGYGVVPFEDDDEERIRATFELVDRLGGEYCSLEFPPNDDGLRDRLLSVADEFDLDLAIHNHGPGATYSRVEEVTRVLESADSPRLGACVDTGHFFRSGEAPADVIRRLGDRVLALHLKDFDDEGNEVVPGTGRLDVSELLDLLETETAFDQPLVIEYEADAENPTPAVEQTVAAVRDAAE
ncbi:sugar phosphate isomerase/epimerase [Halorubrum sp. CSM-61]|uniref:sugar phosphate isomerase/epimerase family protein n=1 Tax=Halorubrum sp. CSM-61 TaxID=2485838 RepID=UPI000F4C8D18|nr:sugar phosphate isomerase/epimerase family protein [Halorubrum sp. CSM-61]